MSQVPSDDRQPNVNEEQRRKRLQCVGSFKAFTQDGECHTVEIWTHFDDVHDRDRVRVGSSKIYLMTADGYDIDRIAQGEYRLVKHPEISLSTDDPNAP